MTGTVGRSDSAAVICDEDQKSAGVYLMTVGVSMSLTAQIKFLGKVVEFNKMTNY